MGTGTKGLHINTTIAGRGPRLQALENNPELNAVVSKLLTGIYPPARDADGRRRLNAPNEDYLETISNLTAQHVSDAQSLFQLLPDMELARQIMISSILSPHDMVSTELLFSVEGKDSVGDMDGVLINILETYFEDTYKIKKLLTPILSDALFEKGAYPMAIIPESSIDTAINGVKRITMESLGDVLDNKGKVMPVGILGPGKADKAATPAQVTESVISVESFNVDTRSATRYSGVVANENLMLVADDNPQVLKMPLLQQRLAQDRVAARFAVSKLSLESYRKQPVGSMSAADEYTLEQTLYKTRHFNHIPVMPIVEEAGENVGHPLVMTLPTESVIPVHVPGNPSEHIGYFVMLDMTGNPLNKSSQMDYYNQLATNLNNADNQVSKLLNMTEAMQNGPKNEKLGQMVEVAVYNYTQMVEADLLHRLKNGIYGDNVAISRPQEVYRIMLARAMMKQQTRLLYIPESLMTYIAFDYNEFGVGKSLVEDTRIIGSIRAMLLFANTMAQIKNSVGQTLMNIELDPEDPDPSATIEELVHEFARVRSRTFPIGKSNPMEIIDYLQSAAIQVAVTGHPGYPETKLDVEDRSTSRTVVDMDLDEALKKRHIASWGLSPETVDLSMDVDFATSIVASNINLTKRVKIYQEILCMHLKDFIAKYTIRSGTLVNQLREAIMNVTEETKKLEEGEKKEEINPDKIISNFLTRLKISLPSPDTVKLENQLAAFENYSTALESAFTAYVSEEMLDMSIVGDASDAVVPTINALKAYFKRQWLRENNVLPELEALIVRDEEGEENFNLLEKTKVHSAALTNALGDFMVNYIKARKKSDASISKAEEEEEGGQQTADDQDQQ